MSRGGAEHRLRHGDLTAVVTEVGGGLRELRHGERHLVRPYDEGEVRPRYRGSVLAPWPNRVVDGRYDVDGETLQLDLTEPERGHALHGFVVWERFSLVDATASSVVAEHRLVPRPSYPFELLVRVDYALGDDGLTWGVTTTNVGEGTAPYGTAGHPYVVAGAGPLDRWTLELPAAQVLEVTPDRLVPTGLADVEGTDFDFRTTRSLEGIALDHALTGLTADPDGLVRARVLDPDGHGVEVAWDPDVLPWVQVHTADLAPPELSRAALALEPMTCPPDAFNDRTDLVLLEPGASHTATWRIGPVTA